MQLILPGIILLLITVAVAYFVLPMVAAPILVMASVALLILAVYLHWKQFGTAEYERATWVNNLRKYSSYIIVAAVLLGAYGFYVMNFAASSGMLPASLSSMVASPALPPVTMPTMGGGMGSMLKTVNSRLGDLMRKGRIQLD